MKFPICPFDQVIILHSKTPPIGLLYGYGFQQLENLIGLLGRVPIVCVGGLWYGDAPALIRNLQHLFGVQVNEHSQPFDWPHVEVHSILGGVALHLNQPPFLLHLAVPPRGKRQASQIPQINPALDDRAVEIRVHERNPRGRGHLLQRHRRVTGVGGGVFHGHLAGSQVNGENVRHVIHKRDDGGLSRKEGVAVLPAEDEGLVGLLEVDGMERVGGGGSEERMGGEDGADGGNLWEGEGVERVVGGVGGVVAEAACGAGGFGLEAVFGGAPGRVGGAVEEVGGVGWPVREVGPGEEEGYGYAEGEKEETQKASGVHGSFLHLKALFESECVKVRAEICWLACLSTNII